MKARVVLLHNTEEAWSKLNFKPECGEVVVYDPDDNYDYARIKIGDGKRFVKDLDFCVDKALAAALTEHYRSETIDGGRITEHTK
jgi:hypothetical protein